MIMVVGFVLNPPVTPAVTPAVTSASPRPVVMFSCWLVVCTEGNVGGGRVDAASVVGRPEVTAGGRVALPGVGVRTSVTAGAVVTAALMDVTVSTVSVGFCVVAGTVVFSGASVLPGALLRTAADSKESMVDDVVKFELSSEQMLENREPEKTNICFNQTNGK